MDKVRLGKVLGAGARQTARTLLSAAEAVAAPDPNPPRQIAAETVRSPMRVVPGAVQAARQAQQAGKSVWSPVAKFSSVLWLEVTGAFFAIFAAFAGTAAWKLRGVLRSQSAAAASDVHHFWMYFAVFALFGYFAVSSFARARRRQRR